MHTNPASSFNLGYALYRLHVKILQRRAQSLQLRNGVSRTGPFYIGFLGIQNSLQDS